MGHRQLLPNSKWVHRLQAIQILTQECRFLPSLQSLTIPNSLTKPKICNLGSCKPIGSKELYKYRWARLQCRLLVHSWVVHLKYRLYKRVWVIWKKEVKAGVFRTEWKDTEDKFRNKTALCPQMMLLGIFNGQKE